MVVVVIVWHVSDGPEYSTTVDGLGGTQDRSVLAAEGLFISPILSPMLHA